MEHNSWKKRRTTSRSQNSAKFRKIQACEELKMQFTYQFLMQAKKNEKKTFTKISKENSSVLIGKICFK